MIKKRLIVDEDYNIVDTVTGEWLDDNQVFDLVNEIHEKYEQLKQDRFICLDCKHSGYAEIGCLCEKRDHWTAYKTECGDYEEL